MSRRFLLLMATLGLVSLTTGMATTVVSHRLVTVRGVIASFDTGHDRTFFLKTPHGLKLEVGVSKHTRIWIDKDPAKPGDLKVGMPALVKGLPFPAHHAIKATSIRVRTK